MTLRTTTIVIEREGRDQGGVFVLTERPAYQASEWFIRAMMLLARSGVDVPPNIMAAGVSGFVTMGLGTVLTGLGKAPFHEVKALLDELLTCITSYQPPGAVQPIRGWEAIKNQVQEPATFLYLHEEVVSLHLGFSILARVSSFRTLAAQMMTAENMPITSMSPEPSAPSSEPVSPA